MKFTTTVLALAVIASAKESHARRRLNPTIVDDESSMSYMLSPNGGGSSSKSSKAPTGSPTGAPTPSPTSSPTPEPKPGECGSTINMGDVINTGGVFTLQKDILDCPCGAFGTRSALTVDGQGIVLNLNGYTVECADIRGGRVIDVLGTANTVMGPGTLKGGIGRTIGITGIGLSKVGGGFHKVNGVTIGPNLDTGIFVQSNDNTIINNFIAEPRFGVQTVGNVRNIIKGNTIILANSARVGIELNIDITNAKSSDDNQIVDNTIIGSSKDISRGIRNRGKRNVIQGNTIDKCGSSGIKVQSDTFKFLGSQDTFTVVSEGVIIKDNSITNTGIGREADQQEFSAGISIENFDRESLNIVVIKNTLAGNVNGIKTKGTVDTVEAGNVIGN